VHNRLSDHPSIDETDVLEQIETVRNALDDLGFFGQVRDIGTDLYGDIQTIRELSPAFVFNLVETVFGKNELLPVVPFLLSAFQIPYTGVSAESLFLTTNKVLAKKIMMQNGIPTPAWFLPERLPGSNPLSVPPDNIALLGRLLQGQTSGFDPFSVPLKNTAASGLLLQEQAGHPLQQGKKYILKPMAEEGSVGLEEEMVFSGIFPRYNLKPGKYFVEEFIEGREFNVSVVGKPGLYKAFPVVEILFHDFPAGKERMLGYRAKWDEQSFEHRHTQRGFHTLRSEPGLEEELVALALKCGDAFEMSGYFRVDFRVSEDKKPYVLEVNGNPCISPDSSFMAAAHQSGLSATEAIRQIILSSFLPSFP
jgi:D-alanine-D-alanine ligase and related ATP-grasp enzymes